MEVITQLKTKPKKKLSAFFDRFTEKSATESNTKVTSSVIISIKPQCSNCDLEMKLIENNTLWFCPMGCESKKVQKE